MTSKTRLVHAGGVAKSELLARLRESGVELNAAAQALFEHERFVPGTRAERYETVEITVGELGFSSGATMPEMVTAAAQLDLVPCPLELAAHLRLVFTNQEEGHWSGSQNPCNPHEHWLCGVIADGAIFQERVQ